MQNPQPLQAQCKAICLGPTRTQSLNQIAEGLQLIAICQNKAVNRTVYVC